MKRGILLTGLFLIITFNVMSASAVNTPTIVQIFPDGAGVANNFTYIINGTAGWQVVDESPANDSDYVSSNTSAQNETFSLGNVTIPLGANITNITVYIRASASSNITRNQSSIFILSGTTAANGTTKTNGTRTNKTASFSTCGDVNCTANWSINPAGGIWNETTINALQAGVRLPITKFGGVSISQLYVNVTYIADTTDPTVTLNDPTDSYSTSSTTIVFNATGSDDLDLTNMTLYGNWSGSWDANLTNSSPINDTLTNFSVTGLPEGIYIWNVLACDGADNCVFDTANRTFTDDSTGPIITLPVYTNATQYNFSDNLTFNIFVTDSLSGNSYCSLNVAGSTNQTLAVSSGWCNGTYNLTGISVGNQTINAYANDTLDNWELNDSYVVQVVSDTTAPIYSNNQTNSTQNGTTISHSVFWTDESPFSGYIFSFDNGNGTFFNDSFVAMDSSNWTNVSKLVNSTVGSTIKWMVYTNDSIGNLNVTDAFQYTTTAPEANSCTCTPGSDWTIINGDQCSLTTTCNLGTGTLRIKNGALRIDSTGFLSSTHCYVNIGSSFFIINGGKLICR